MSSTYSQNSSLANDFIQYNLLHDLFQEEAREKSKKAEVKSSKKGRSYDVGVLRYIGWHQYVTAHQFVYRFFIYDGKGGRYGFRLLRNLIDRGLIESLPLDPDKGSVSRQVLTLTDKGWAEIGIKKRKEPRTNNPLAVRDYRLQFTEMMLERQLEGWNLYSGKGKFEVLRRWALRSYRRMLTDTERLQRDQVEKMGTEKLSVPMLVRGEKNNIEPRIILPIRQGSSYRKLIERLPSFALFPKIEMELVCPDPVIAERARDYIERWAAKSRTNYELYQVDNFRMRPHPKDAPIPSVSRYAEIGLKPPRTLL